MHQSAFLYVGKAPLRESILEKIARRIGTKWTDLANRLDFNEEQIHIFMSAPCNDENKRSWWPMYLMLASYRERFTEFGDMEMAEVKTYLVQAIATLDADLSRSISQFEDGRSEDSS